MVWRGTFAEVYKRHPYEFFCKVYADLLRRYSNYLADNRKKDAETEWEKAMLMMDSKTIPLFDHILKGVNVILKAERRKQE